MTPGRHASPHIVHPPVVDALTIDRPVEVERPVETDPARHTVRLGPPSWPGLAAAGAAVAVFGWRMGAASPWRDEAATFSACRRSPAELIELAGRVDAVHLVYYLLAQGVLAVHDSVTAVRLVSVAAMALTAGLVTALGRRIASTELGIAAGATFVALPVVSRWAQDARPIALFTLLTTVATGLLVEALRAPGGRRWWVGYGMALVALGSVNVLALLIVPAQLAYILLAHPVRRLRAWSVAVTCAGVPLLPWLAFTFTQRDQVAWIEPPHLYDLTALYIHAFGSKLVPPVVAVAAVAVLVLSRGLPGGAAGHVFVLGACWATVPPVLLWTISLRFPLWDAHYLVFVMPGLALLVAAEIATVTAAVRRRRRRVARERRRLRPADPRNGAAIGPVAADRRRPDAVTGLIAIVVVPALAVIGMSDQITYRAPASGHDEDVRGVAAYLEANARPGDAVLFLPVSLRDVRSLYPERFAALDDVALLEGPAASGTLHGVEAAPTDLVTRLTGRSRVWLVTGDFGSLTAEADTAKLAALESGHRPVLQTTVPAFRIVLYQQYLPVR